MFQAGKDDFEEVEGVGDGLGPRFNLDGCAACHSQPAVGGTSPAVNPQVAGATAFGARNFVPFFVTSDGPVREARFKYRPDGARDGGVHALFVVSGRVDPTGDASGCDIRQEDFAAQSRNDNLIFRIPTPVFGAGLSEQIPDGAISANQTASRSQKSSLGINGRPSRVRIDSGTTNFNGNDGTIARFGWKAQNKSLLLFSGEAYNVEMGISNELSRPSATRPRTASSRPRRTTSPTWTARPPRTPSARSSALPSSCGSWRPRLRRPRARVAPPPSHEGVLSSRALAAPCAIRRRSPPATPPWRPSATSP